eukprot:TRINITY_DN2070_c0_g1_i1.p1 TRINITY_DN2070_c0_g1~~TRINITY_DN2070_c0_g1_i1.p1  ORF type:complete len:156 (-),score=29.43 TRINITY_DN2070_c0_g1_i1:16-483(-)
MKLIFIGATVAVIYLMMKKYKKTYAKEEDNFNVLYLIVPSLVTGALFNIHQITNITEILWAFSVFLEAVAIFPQIILIKNMEGVVEGLTSHYIICLGGYRFLYLVNWIYRFITEYPNYIQYTIWIAGLIQAAVYSDLFYHYFTSTVRGEDMVLPS